MKNPGYLVETHTGLKGRTRNKDHFVNGKIIIYVENPDGSPKLDSRDKQLQVLADKSKIKIIGFLN